MSIDRQALGRQRITTDSMEGILAYLLAALLYGAVAAYYWSTRAVAAPASAPAVARPVPAWQPHVILLPLGVHGYSLAESLFGPDGLYLGVGSAVSAIVFLAILVYWAGSRLYSMATLHTLLAPVAVVASLLPAVLPASHPLPNTDAPAFKFHLLLALLAYSLFTIAALHAVLMAFMEKRLHQAARSALFSDFPPLLSMERLLFRIIGAGFVLLTLTLASGIVFSEEVFGTPLQFTHKTLFGIVSWVIYGALLGGRRLYGWRGRVAVRWTLAGFLALLLAYVGSKFVLEVILGR